MKTKNFALKQLYPGSRSSLPRIIGGSDLAVHQTSERLDNDEWFVEAREVRLLVNTVTGNDLKDNWYILSIIIYNCFMSCQADVERQRDERRADELFRYFKDRSQPVLLWLIFRGPLAFVDSTL